MLLVFAAGMLSSCSQHGTGVTNRAYHNMTAHYNAYYLALEKVTEAEQTLFKNRKDDYTRILDVLIPMDSVRSNSVKSQAEYVIQKSSIAIGRHKNSKWLDDSYLLVAKARHLLMDYPNAIETYKYVNSESTSPSARHQAMTGLLMVFTEMQDYNYSRAVIDKLRKEKLKKRDLVEFYLARAQYHLELEEFDPALAVLNKTVKMMHRGERRARVNFIIAQLYQQLGKKPESYDHYVATLHNNPSFELAFYANLNMIQVFQSKRAQDNKRLMANFRKLLRDAKNAEYKDKIYYQMGLYEHREKHYPKAVEYLKQSVQASTSDPAQKAYAYLKLGEIHFEDLQQYNLAKAYYDSTMLSLPATVPDYDAVAKRHKVLDSFVANITTIHTEDSLQRLVRMDEQSLDQYLDKLLDAEEQKQKEQARKNTTEIQREASSIFDNATPQDNRNRDNADGKWYFSNGAAVSQGRTAFTRKWGNRPLEDNWRRSGREREMAVTQDPRQNPNRPGMPPAEAPAKPDRKQLKESMIAGLPRSQEALAASDKKLEDAFYNLGKIYELELKESPNALKTFDTLLTRFPGTEYKPEVYYFLYLIHKNQADPEQETYRTRLITEFSGSSFARLVTNPDYQREDNLADFESQKAFSDAYEQYEYGNYAEADRLVNEGLGRFTNNKIAERFKVLRIRIIGKTQNVNAYRNALHDFATQHPESALLPYVQNLLKATDGFANRSK